MNAKGKADATAGKQKRAAKGAKSVEAAAQTQSFNSLGEFHPSKFFAPDKGRDNALHEWPQILQIGGDELQQSFAVATLAVQLCGLQCEQLSKLWAEDETHKRALLKATHVPDEQARVWNQREKQLRARVKSLDPTAFLPAAWRLIREAREQVMRPQTNVEYLAERGDTYGALTDVIGRIRSEARIPFRKLCDPERNAGDTEEIHGFRWRVYRGKEALRHFEKLFWSYWQVVGSNWQAYSKGMAGAEGFTSLAAIRSLYGENEIQELARLAGDAEQWQAKGSTLLFEWQEGGILPVDFVAIARFRRAKNRVRQDNVKKANAKRGVKRPQGRVRRSVAK